MEHNPSIDKLAKVCGLLASDNHNERAAAAYLATEIIKSMDMTWEQVIKGRTVAPSPQPQTKPQTGVSSHVEVCTYILHAHRELLSTFEKEFLGNMADKYRHRRITDRQKAYIVGIILRCSRCVSRAGMRFPYKTDFSYAPNG